jgi:hypothetical protein
VRHVQSVLQSLQSPDRAGQRVTFQFTEAELNEYLAYSLRVTPRPGIRKLAVRLLPDDAFTVRAILDFTAIEKWNSWIVPDALKAIAGTQPLVEMEVKFQAQDGRGTYKLKSVGGPAGTLLADAVSWVIQAIGLHQPEYYDTANPIPLPFGINRIRTAQGTVSGDTGS